MANSQTYRADKSRLDWVSMALYLSLLVIGWLMVYASTYKEEASISILSLQGGMGMQTLWVGIALIVFLAAYIIDWKFWQTFAFPIFIFCMLLLALVLFLGTEIKGAKSWFIFGNVSFQPAELAKFGTCLAVSSYISYYKTDLKIRKNQIIAISIFLLPMLLILLQPDAGSAIVFTAFFVILYREGLSGIYFVIAFVLFLLFVCSLVFKTQTVLSILFLIPSVFLLFTLKKKDAYFLLGLSVFLGLNAVAIFLSFEQWLIYFNAFVLVIMTIIKIRQKEFRLMALVWPATVFCILLSLISRYAFEEFLEPHQQDRINVWLKPSECNEQGSLYNLLQSKMAIGSGGFQGKGFLEGTMTKLDYVPEQSTDFIFSTIGEEQGFIGSFAIIAIFVMFILRIIKLGERNKNNFVRHYAYGLAGLLFIHFFINIGMTMGIVPIVGIPLPFISKGGSALLSFTIMFAVLMRMDSARY